MGFKIELFAPRDGGTISTTTYRLDLIGSYFCYVVGQKEPWHYVTKVGKDSNQIKLRIENIFQLYALLKMFRVHFKKLNK